MDRKRLMWAIIWTIFSAFLAHAFAKAGVRPFTIADDTKAESSSIEEYNSITTARELRRWPLPVEVAVGVKRLVNASPTVSPDGGLLAFTVINESNQKPLPLDAQSVISADVPLPDRAGEVWVYDLKSAIVTKLTHEKSSSWAPSWSPDGSLLAFFSDRDGQARIWIWDRTSGRVHCVSDAIVKLQGVFDERPEWLPNGRGILARFLPLGLTLQEAVDLRFASIPRDTGKADELTVRSFSSESAMHVPYNWNSLLCDFGIVDVRNGRVNRFVLRTLAERFYKLSPDRSLLAYNARKMQLDGKAAAEFTVVSVTDGLVKFVVSDQPGDGVDCAWSPNSRILACMLAIGTVGAANARPDRKQLNLLDIHARKLRSFSGKVSAKVPVFATKWDHEGKYLYSRIGSTLWRIPAADPGSAQSRTLPPGTIQLIADSNGFAWHPEGPDSIGLSMFDHAVQRSGYRVMNFTSGRSRMLLEGEESQFSGDPVPMPSGRDFIYNISDVGHYPDLWIFETRRGKSRRLTAIDPEYNSYEMGRSRLIEWETSDGRKLRGPLLLPPGYRSGRRYPLVVWVYGGQPSGALSAVGLTGVSEFNFQVLATRGYAVFFPEGPQRIGAPMKDVADAVLPAVDHVVEMGIADPDRLAVMGNSYGGYCVQALIVQTTRFKAAIMSVSQPGNLFIEYTDMPAEGVGGFGLPAQIKMSGTPWEYRDQYLDNSPFFFYDKVKTPLLMQEGMNDSPALVHGSDATYLAFRQLGLEVEYLRYYGESHEITGYSNRVDFWNKRLVFLAKHLDVALDDRGGIVFAGEKAKSQDTVARNWTTPRR